MSAHKGPLFTAVHVFGEGDDETESWCVQDADGAIVAVVADRDNDHETAELFAAAPDLLGALRAIVAWQADPQKDSASWERRLYEARAAIAKAEGSR